MEPLFPAIYGRDSKVPDTEIPFLIILALTWLAVLLSKLLGKRFNLPIWGLTPTEAFKVSILEKQLL